MSRESGNSQARSSQRTERARLTTRRKGYFEFVSDWRAGRLAVSVVCRPISHECRLSRDPKVLRVPLFISDYTGWRDRTDPARRSFPSPDRVRVIYADGLVRFDDLTAAFIG